MAPELRYGLFVILDSCTGCVLDLKFANFIWFIFHWSCIILNQKIKNDLQCMSSVKLSVWHILYVCMSIWVSKEVFGPQECSQPSYIFYKIVFRAIFWNILIHHFSFVFLRISFVYLIVLETPLNDKARGLKFVWCSDNVIEWDKPPYLFQWFFSSILTRCRYFKDVSRPIRR